jgi:hypothetical protein
MPSDLERTLSEFHDVLFPAGSVDPGPLETSTEDAEAAFKLRLLAAGVITRIPNPREAAFARRDFKPIKIQGKPLSETIIEERGRKVGWVER